MKMIFRGGALTIEHADGRTELWEFPCLADARHAVSSWLAHPVTGRSFRDFGTAWDGVLKASTGYITT